MASIEKQSKPIEKQSKTIKGGARPGAGRKTGIRNKKTAKLLEAVEKSGATPLEYLLSVMRNECTDPKERLSAALGAAPYVHAKLASIEINAHITTHEATLDELA